MWSQVQGEEMCCRVLDGLEFAEKFGGCAVKDAVTVANTGCDEGVINQLCF